MSTNKSNKILIYEWLTYGVDIHNRRIYFGNIDYEDSTDITPSNIQLAIRAIDIMLSMSNKPIQLEFCSYGGSVYDSLALIDKIEESPCKFIFIGRGAIMSAASYIMAVCDERYLSQNSTVLIHDVYTDHEYASQTDLNIDSEECLRLKQVVEKIYAKNSHLSIEFWEMLSKRDLYLTVDECLKIGLIDQIIPYKKRGNLRGGIRQKTFKNVPSEKEISKIVQKLLKRVKINNNIKITVERKVEDSEPIQDYDVTTEQMINLGLTKKEG